MKERILVVDDSSLSRRTLRQMLESAGYFVEEAADGSQALERYFLQPHDLVLLDMVMEQMYGLEVLEKLRQLNPAVRVIIASADIQSSTRTQVKEAGAAAMINKPFNKEKLLELVGNVLQGGVAWS
jgi:two-component system chemotaxis response regulator CheY